MKKIKILAMDVDGTLTDGHVYISDQGEAMKAFDIKDGMGIVKARERGIVPAIITGRKSQIVVNRAKELKIPEVFQAVGDKTEVLRSLAQKYECALGEIAFIGDDENDLEAMGLCGFCACPADAVDAVKERADYVCARNGGRGAVRELIDMLLKERE